MKGGLEPVGDTDGEHHRVEIGVLPCGLPFQECPQDAVTSTINDRRLSIFICLSQR